MSRGICDICAGRLGWRVRGEFPVGQQREIAKLVEGVGQALQQRPARFLAVDEVEPAALHVTGLAGHNPVAKGERSESICSLVEDFCMKYGGFNISEQQLV